MTTPLIVWTVLLILNFTFGIQDVNAGKTGWRPALTWTAVGVSLSSLLDVIAHLI